MRLTLDSESLYKWLVKHRFDLCLGVSIIWITLVIVVLWPTSADYDWRLILKNTGKALAPLGIVVTLFLNFTTAVKNAEKDQTGDKDAKLLKYKQVENAMLIIAKYDDDDYLAAKIFLKHCSQNKLDKYVVADLLSNLSPKSNYDNCYPNDLKVNPEVSVVRYLNYFDEVRLAIQGEIPFADQDIVVSSLCPAILSSYEILSAYLVNKQANMVSIQILGQNQMIKDHADFEAWLKQY